jgi:hypothetical protein
MYSYDDIPEHLVRPAKAALTWLNQTRTSSYELTGLVDVAETTNIDKPFEFGLVLCDGDLCAREQVRVVPDEGSFHFDFVADATPDIPHLLDPPENVRRNWLDQQLEKFEFILLLYYRGRW